MLINQILFQQKLGQENNCTIFLTKTTDINGLWRSQRAGGRKKEGAERLSGREHIHRTRPILKWSPQWALIAWKFSYLHILHQRTDFLSWEQWASSRDYLHIVSGSHQEGDRWLRPCTFPWVLLIPGPHGTMGKARNLATEGGLTFRRCFLAMDVWASYITSRHPFRSPTADVITIDLMSIDARLK